MLRSEYIHLQFSSHSVIEQLTENMSKIKKRKNKIKDKKNLFGKTLNIIT